MAMQICDTVLLLGSINLANVEEAMRTSASLLGPYVTRLPDGEVSLDAWGQRRGFVTQLRPVVTTCPWMEPDPEEASLGHRRTLAVESHRNTRPPRYRVRSGMTPAEMVFPTTGLAETALRSYEIFRRLKQQGTIPGELRFQFCFPTVAAFLNTHVIRDAHPAVEEPYFRALIADLERILAVVPRDELTLQWDVSTEMAQWEGVREAHFDDVQNGVIARLAAHCDAVPDGVEMGVHLCYGNFGLRHWREPQSLGNVSEVYNRLATRVKRKIDYLHMPVPIARSDDAYFAPLDGLCLRPETQLYLGLVHEQDGIEGARRRIEAARRHTGPFGISTECGFGERSAEIVPDLMRLHVEIASGLDR